MLFFVFEKKKKPILKCLDVSLAPNKNRFGSILQYTCCENMIKKRFVDYYEIFTYAQHTNIFLSYSHEVQYDLNNSIIDSVYPNYVLLVSIIRVHVHYYMYIVIVFIDLRVQKMIALISGIVKYNICRMSLMYCFTDFIVSNIQVPINAERYIGNEKLL